MRALLLALPLLLAACTTTPDTAPDAATVPGAAGGQVAATPPGDPGPPDPRDTIVDDSTGVVAPDGEVLANAKRIRIADGGERISVNGAGPHRYLVAMQSGQRLSVEAEGGARASVFDPGGKPLAQSTRSWSGTVNQTADFVVEATGSGAMRLDIE